MNLNVPVRGRQAQSDFIDNQNKIRLLVGLLRNWPRSEGKVEILKGHVRYVIFYDNDLLACVQQNDLVFKHLIEYYHKINA